MFMIMLCVCVCVCVCFVITVRHSAVHCVTECRVKLYNNQRSAQGLIYLCTCIYFCLTRFGFLLVHLQRQVYDFGMVQVFWVWC
jgi:hypothetical protein